MRKDLQIGSDFASIGDVEADECRIYDAESKKQRTELASKQVRKVFAHRPIYIKLSMLNTLKSAIWISNLHAIVKGARCEISPTKLVFEGLQQ